MATPEISVVIPVYNEEENLPLLAAEILSHHNRFKNQGSGFPSACCTFGTPQPISVEQLLSIPDSGRRDGAP